MICLDVIDESFIEHGSYNGTVLAPIIIVLIIVVVLLIAGAIVALCLVKSKAKKRAAAAKIAEDSDPETNEN